jgi:hypothetical protein
LVPFGAVYFIALYATPMWRHHPLKPNEQNTTHFEICNAKAHSRVRGISVEATKLNAWTTNAYVVDAMEMAGTHS